MTQFSKILFSLIFLFGTFSVSSNALAVVSIIDSYSETNVTFYQDIYFGDKVSVGQSFYNATPGTLTEAKFFIKKYGNPTGNIYASVYAHSGTFGSDSEPSGSAIALSDSIDIATLGTTASLKSFHFSGYNKILLESDTNYIVTINYAGGDVNNRLNVAEDDSENHAGNEVYYFGLWNARSNVDCIFYAYSDSYPGSFSDVTSFGSELLTDTESSLSLYMDFAVGFCVSWLGVILIIRLLRMGSNSLIRK